MGGGEVAHWSVGVGGHAGDTALPPMCLPCLPLLSFMQNALLTAASVQVDDGSPVVVVLGYDPHGCRRLIIAFEPSGGATRADRISSKEPDALVHACITLPTLHAPDVRRHGAASRAGRR